MKDLYIALDGAPVPLRRLDFTLSAEIYKGLATQQSVFEVKEEIWRQGNSKLPNGTQAVFVSGYNPPVSLDPQANAKIVGELANFRTDLAGQPKNYRTILVSTGDNSLFQGKEFKDYPLHWYQGAHPTGDIWGKIHPVRRMAVSIFCQITGA
jgi:hypothetical protein